MLKKEEEKEEKLSLEKKILPPLLPGLEPETFRLRVCRSTSEPSLRSCRDSTRDLSTTKLSLYSPLPKPSKLPVPAKINLNNSSSVVLPNPKTSLPCCSCQASLGGA